LTLEVARRIGRRMRGEARDPHAFCTYVRLANLVPQGDVVHFYDDCALN
jgi:hypothetical protein